jgi:hypothetical protein
MPTIERLAFDKASVRTIDTDGRMHVAVTPILEPIGVIHAV